MIRNMLHFDGETRKASERGERLEPTLILAWEPDISQRGSFRREDGMCGLLRECVKVLPLHPIRPSSRQRGVSGKCWPSRQAHQG